MCVVRTARAWSGPLFWHIDTHFSIAASTVLTCFAVVRLTEAGRTRTAAPPSSSCAGADALTAARALLHKRLFLGACVSRPARV